MAPLLLLVEQFGPVRDKIKLAVAAKVIEKIENLKPYFCAVNGSVKIGE